MDMRKSVIAGMFAAMAWTAMISLPAEAQDAFRREGPSSGTQTRGAESGGAAVGTRGGTAGAVGERQGSAGAVGTRGGTAGEVGKQEGGAGAVGTRQGGAGAVGERPGPAGGVGERKGDDGRFDGEDERLSPKTRGEKIGGAVRGGQKS